MGSLTLPGSGTVYIDTQIFIYSVEKHPDYAPLLRPLWQAVEDGRLEVVTSELTLLETLVAPLKNGDVALASAYEQMFQLGGIRLLPVSQPVLREAARLRATILPLRTPDALHAATALLSGSACFVTNDNAFRRVPGLPVILLDDARGP
jgi:predicted nucleic acid-binding protein